MSTVPTPLRKLLEGTITDARDIAERGAHKTLRALAVHEADPYPHMSDAQRELRKSLQAQARQLGNRESRTMPGMYETKHLAEKLAYDQWHRLLFARYLVENDLLIHPEHQVPVSLEDCEDLAPTLGLKDAWAVAARFAAKELPEIFRADDPVGEVELAVEDRNPLIQLVIELPVEVFTASDSLGWCYQFWQAKEKKRINKSEKKISADELPAVTQLFTDDYMVDFLLDNTLGAWHAGKVLAVDGDLAERAGSEDELRDSISLPGCRWKYLRFKRSDAGTWTPAAGTFDGWPKEAQDLKCFDPCMGSGHFVVAMFERLVSLRAFEESLDEETSAGAVIRHNLYGLEIDPRCAQIAAFNLALTAWRRVGHHFRLPTMHLACSGLAPNAKKEEWLKLAGDSQRMGRGMERLYALFKDAPSLGSLINPRLNPDMNIADYQELQPLLETALTRDAEGDAHEMAVTARGLVKAAELLAGQFTLVATNVPYLGRAKQDQILSDYCERIHREAKADLATVFIERFISLTASAGTAAFVTKQEWLFLGKYLEVRRRSLRESRWSFLARLGPRAFEAISGERVNVSLHAITKTQVREGDQFFSLDVASQKTPTTKANSLLREELGWLGQLDQLKNPDSRVTTEASKELGPRLGAVADSYQGIVTGDLERFRLRFFEVPVFGTAWVPFRTTVSETGMQDGCQSVLLWEEGDGSLHRYASETREQLHDMHESGNRAWSRLGIAINRMSSLQATIYYGEHFDNNVAVLIPRDEAMVDVLLTYCVSPEFGQQVKRLDRTLKVTNKTLLKVPFDVTRWQEVSTQRPLSLFSADPTQWLFDGNPKGSHQPLHAAAARLLGYQWPRQAGSGFPDCPALGPDSLEPLADSDGVVCFSATKGEAPAAERLRALVSQALGEFDLKSLLADAGPKGSRSETLEEWLRDEFFEQHCALFLHRPFIWHIWDGHKSGFSALVNYHKLDHANLEKLTYSYLGDWIRRQQAAVDAGEAGSDARLEAAKRLQERLKLILQGEPPFDLFVRWKPLSQQAIGWHPDLNDGVRMNIRPFLAMDIPGGKKGAGILRTKPNIKWEKDRGKEPVRDKKEFPWFWGWDGETIDYKGVGTSPDGNRWNDLHYTNAVKLAARASKQ